MVLVQKPPPASASDPAAASIPAEPAWVSEPVNLDSESVAGEEDPGASLDMPAPAGPAEQMPTQLTPTPPGEIHPGDEAAEGTPGTAQAICRECGGSHDVANGPCPACDGSGKVTVGLGGA